MLAESLISPHLPFLETHLLVSEAYERFDRAGTGELPLINQEEEVIAVLERKVLEVSASPEQTLEDVSLQHFTKATIRANQHVFDVIRVMNEFELNLLPVVNNDNYFVGCIKKDTAFHYLNNWLTLSEPGSIVVLETKWVNYSLKEIASIVESNGLHIMGCLLTRVPNTEQLYVTLKLNEATAPSVVQAFERYSYTIHYTYFIDGSQNLAQDHYDALMRYLEI